MFLNQPPARLFLELLAFGVVTIAALIVGVIWASERPLCRRCDKRLYFRSWSCPRCGMVIDPADY